MARNSDRVTNYCPFGVLPLSSTGSTRTRPIGSNSLGSAGELITCGDGADWIWKQMDINFPMAAHQFLDFYHFSEHVHAAASALYGEGTDKAHRWAAEKLHTVKHEGSERLMRSLRESLRRRTRTSDREALNSLIAYATKHLTRMNYPLLRQQGIDIGTGPEESACKNVVGKRLKGVGMRWTTDNLEAMARLRAITAGSAGMAGFWKAYRELPQP